MSCPDEALSALVDDALPADERDRALAHVAGCAPCRTEVEQLRALKLRLSALGTATPDPSADLVARLRGLAVPGVEPAEAVAAIDEVVTAAEHTDAGVVVRMG